MPGGAIAGKYWQVSGLLGELTSNELPTHDEVGRYQSFAGGIIVWHPDTGAFELHGDILTRYRELGGPAWGYPVSDELGASDGRGRFNRFRNVPGGYGMNIYWTQDTGAHEISGQIWQRYSFLGWEGSALGYPTARGVRRDAAALGRTRLGTQPHRLPPRARAGLRRP